MYKKPVIVFEGIEGSGKTFYSNIVSKYLQKKKIQHVRLREPGGSKNSEIIRNLILDKKNNFDKNTDLLLYLAARSENIKTIRRYYKKKIILIDRFSDSTIAYQHYGLGVKLPIIKRINEYLLKDFRVDFTFLNTVNHKNMKIRLKKRKKLNRYDKFDKNFYKRVQKGFIQLANKKKKFYKIIDSNLSINTNKLIILKKIDQIIK